MKYFGVENVIEAAIVLFCIGIVTPPASAKAPKYLFGVPQLVNEVNATGASDHSPALSSDELELMFSRFDGANDEDIFVARRASKDVPFGMPMPVESINTPEHDLHPMISLDGLSMYFARTDARITKSWIWSATRPSLVASFESPTRVFSELPGEGCVAPSLSSDGRLLYFQCVADETADVYVSRRDSAIQPWGTPELLPELTNPARWQSRPDISADSNTLFFFESGIFEQSTRSARGDGDLMMLARSSADGNWSPPINLGSALNTAGYEDFAELSADGKTLYFTRGRGNAGDIWQAPVLEFETEKLSGAGATYAQDFNGSNFASTSPGIALPTGWTFTANDYVFANTTTEEFPAAPRNYSGVYNAGVDGDIDRSLATNVSLDESGELNFRAIVRDSPVRAMRLGFDLEVWQVFSGLARNGNSTASFQILIEADAGNGFEPIADLGTATTGATLMAPSIGSVVNGNDQAYRTTYDSRLLEVDIPQDATLRVRWIAKDAPRRAVVFGLDNFFLRIPGELPGDANLDGLFDSSDLVRVFQVGEYEDTIAGNSTWIDGDWNNDSDFSSSDLVAAFVASRFEPPNPVVIIVPETSSHLPLCLGIAALIWRPGRKGVR